MTHTLGTTANQCDQAPGRIAPRPLVSRLTPSAQRYPATAWTTTGETLLHLNEVKLPPSPQVIRAIQYHAESVGDYPAPQPPNLVQAIARRTGVATEQIVIGAGIDELLQAAAHAYLAPESDAVMPAPAFPKYRQTAMLFEARVVERPLTADGRADAHALLEAVTENTTLLFLPTPNNPTGGALDVEDFATVIAGLPPHVLLVVDEAYAEFARVDGATNPLEALINAPFDWMVLRTFSKAYGLAGLRIGYALTSRCEVAEAMRRILPVFNVSSLAAVAALAALRDEAYTAAVVAEVVYERDRLATRLASLGHRCLPSATNFLAVNLGRPATPIAARLRASGVRVALIPGRDYEHYLRVSIGTQADSERFLEALQQAKQEGDLS